MNILSLDGVTHVFPDGTRALYGVSIEIASGELVLLAGPNGSGKTVLAKHLNGLLLPTEGTVSIDGRRIGGSARWAKSAVGLVFQDADSQIVGQTVEEDAAFGPRNLGLDDGEIEARVVSVLRVVGLEQLSSHRPHLLSGGEKRRLAIAGILAMDPRILVLDEPFAGLDYPGVRMVLETIDALHRSGHTIIVITHDVHKVLAHVTRLVILDGGRIAHDGTPADLLVHLEDHGLRGVKPRPGASADPRILVEECSWLR